MEVQDHQKTKDKMSVVSPHFKGRELLYRLKNRPNYILPLEDSSQFLRKTQTQSKGVEYDTPSTW